MAIKGLPVGILRRLYVFFVTVVCAWGVGGVLEHWRVGEKPRRFLMQKLMALNPRILEVQNTFVVEINDDALQRTSESFFQYLTDLIEKADRREARTIVLDFNFAENGAVDPDSMDGFDAFRKMLVRVSKHRPIVLPLTLDPGAKDNNAATYDKSAPLFKYPDLAPGSNLRVPQNENLIYGFINGDLSEDPRALPVKRWVAETNDEVPALALAAVRAAYRVHPSQRLREFERWKNGDRPPTIQFVPTQPGCVRSSEAFLAETVDNLDWTRGNIIVIGGTYHTGAKSEADTFWTPVGQLTGAELHRQYAEALLDGHYYREVSGVVAWTVKLGAEALLFFTVLASRAFLIRLIMLLVVPVAMVLVSYLSFTNFGVSYDFLLTLVAIVCVFVVDAALSLRHWALNRRKEGAA